MPAPRDQRHRSDREQDPAQRPEGTRWPEDVSGLAGERGAPGEWYHEQCQRQREVTAPAERPQPRRRAGHPCGVGGVPAAHLVSSVTSRLTRRIARPPAPRLHVVRTRGRLSTPADVGRKPLLARRHLRDDRPPWHTGRLNELRHTSRREWIMIEARGLTKRY